MVAHQQLVDALQPAVLVGHVVLYAEDAHHAPLAVAAVHGERHLVVAQESVVLGVVGQCDHGRVHLPLTNVKNGGVQLVKVGTVKKQREVQRTVVLLHGTLLRQEEILTGSGEILPDAQASGL